MSYWIFKAGTDRYRIDDRLREPDDMMTWRVSRYQERIQKADIVFVWRSGVPKGICAVMKVEQHPFPYTDAELAADPFAIPGVPLVDDPTVTFTRCRITHRFPLIEASVIKKIPGLELFSFFSAFQLAVNFSITRPEGSILMGYIEQHITAARELAALPKEVTQKQVVIREPRQKTARPAAAPVVKPKSTVKLLKCAECGSFVINTDTDRHVREVHGGEEVGWKKVN